jgi:hypothetical protein
MATLLMKHHFLNPQGAVRVDDGRRLSRALGINLLDMRLNTPIPANTTVINWGSSSWGGRVPAENQKVVNNPSAVAKAIDKRVTLQILQDAGVPTLQFANSLTEIADWINEGKEVVGRKILRGSGGEGVVMLSAANWQQEGNDCRLFTLYWRKTHEFRVHVAKDTSGEYQIIDFTKKRCRGDVQANMQIRSHGNGWIFARSNVELPDAVRSAAIAAVNALGLDFGAVDIGAKRSLQEVAVFEVNTAPGLDGDTTFNAYVEYFRGLVQ